MLGLGFGPVSRMGMREFVKLAGELWEMGRELAVPEVYLLGPAKTGTTWFWECMAGKGLCGMGSGMESGVG